jgi:hypothetical protein
MTGWSLRDIIVGECAWATLNKHGVCHAADRYLGERWQIRCNRGHAYPDLSLYALDNEPTEKICRNPACRHAYEAWLRLHKDDQR